jgi:hypothetical protein
MLIFSLIVIVPFLLLLVEYFRPDLVEQLIQERPGAKPALHTATMDRTDPAPLP